MAISALLNVPRTVSEWNQWGFAHRDHHQLIRQAIFTQSGGADNLFEYELDPIPAKEIQEWLSRNQQSHDDFNGVLNLQGQDLEGVDISNRSQLEAWIYLHWQEHSNASFALGI